MDGLNQNMFGLDVYSYNSQTIQEVVVETGGTSAEAMTGGVQLNIIPKDGGNTWSGSFSTSWTGPSLQSDNLDDDLRARGLQTGASVKRFRDNGGAFGGPIARDGLWFYTAHRCWDAPEVPSRAPTSTRVRTSCFMRRTSIGWPLPTGNTTTTTFV